MKILDLAGQRIVVPTRETPVNQMMLGPCGLACCSLSIVHPECPRAMAQVQYVSPAK
ncbi:hypothetical protein [Pseudomonas sp. SDI]|uniref:hypothetical protein n=1 Tax=Pseudomonas sp. SDI TaxID=2170734 RepID=UPI001403B334|nr:hypothetical protein [Pseudomonas sp. SDI]